MVAPDRRAPSSSRSRAPSTPRSAPPRQHLHRRRRQRLPRRRRDAALPAPAAQPGRRPASSQSAQSATGRVVGDVLEACRCRRTGCGCARGGSRRAPVGRLPLEVEADRHALADGRWSRASSSSSNRSAERLEPEAPVLVGDLAHQLGPEAVGAHLEQRRRARAGHVVVADDDEPRVDRGRARTAVRTRRSSSTSQPHRAVDAVGRRANSSDQRTARASAPEQPERAHLVALVDELLRW